MAYPIKSRSVTLDHKGGTKSYHLQIIENADGKSVFISRWGKTGQFGEMKVQLFDSPTAALKAWDSKEREKSRNGYSQTGPTRDTRANVNSEFSKAVGLTVFNKMGAAAVKHLDGVFDTRGMREVDPAQYDEDTGAKLDVARKADISEALENQRAIEAKKAAEAYENHPTFGRF